MLNYFTLLNLKEHWDIDQDVLRQQYFKAQQYWHPDNFQSGAEKLHASQQTANINEAYQALKIPLKRGQHLLALAGIKPNAEQTVQDTALLEESMHWRERLIDEASDVVKAEAKALLQDIYDIFYKFYKEQNYTKAEKTLLRAVYLEKLISN